jgi:hypothetical protein
VYDLWSGAWKRDFNRSTLFLIRVQNCGGCARGVPEHRGPGFTGIDKEIAREIGTLNEGKVTKPLKCRLKIVEELLPGGFRVIPTSFIYGGVSTKKSCLLSCGGTCVDSFPCLPFIA